MRVCSHGRCDLLVCLLISFYLIIFILLLETPLYWVVLLICVKLQVLDIFYNGFAFSNNWLID